MLAVCRTRDYPNLCFIFIIYFLFPPVLVFKIFLLNLGCVQRNKNALVFPLLCLLFMLCALLPVNPGWFFRHEALSEQNLDRFLFFPLLALGLCYHQHRD